MKKLAFYLLAFTVSASVGFAQTAPAAPAASSAPVVTAPAPAATPAPAPVVASVTGGLYTGVIYGHTSSADTVYQYDYWNQSVPNEEWIDIDFTSGSYGFAAEFSQGDTTAGGGAASFDQMEVWGNLLDNKVKLEVGFIGNNDYTTVGDHSGAGWCGWNAVGGFLLNIYPVDGLKLGYYQPVATANAAQQGNPIWGTTNSDNTVSDAWSNAAFGVAYSVPKTYKLQAEVENSNNGVSINGSFKVTGLKNVTLSGETFLNNIGTSTAPVLSGSDGYKSTNAYFFDEIAGYNIGDLYLGGVFTEYKFANYSTIGYTLGFEPSYTVGTVTYVLEAIYKSLVDGGNNATNGYDFSAYAKWVPDDHMTFWFGIDFTNASVDNMYVPNENAKHTVISTPTFSVPLSVMYTF